MYRWNCRINAYRSIHEIINENFAQNILIIRFKLLFTKLIKNIAKHYFLQLIYVIVQEFSKICLAWTAYNVNFIYRDIISDHTTLYCIHVMSLVCIRVQKFLVNENARDIQDSVPLSKASSRRQLREKLNAIYKPRCTPDCMPSVRKRYNAWSYETFIGSIVRSAFWRELVRPHNRDAKACERTRGHAGMKLEHTSGEEGWGKGGKRAHGAESYIPLWDRTLRNRHELVLTMHFAEARLYPVTCRCVTSFHQLTKLANGDGRCDRSSAEYRAPKSLSSATLPRYRVPHAV